MNQKQIMKNYGMAAAHLVIIVPLCTLLHKHVHLHVHIHGFCESLEPLLKNELLSTGELSPLILWLALIS